ncbi:MAG: 3-oxoacyl-ACP reductase FabG [Oscillospiraceae bacterium]|nr:3-oxoacyl-ACP reductase FabG [Oscillospiraceae bacterium]
MVALVTGSSGGIGEGIARKFASLGYSVAVNYNTSKTDAEIIVNDIINAGGTAKAYKCNVQDISEVNKMILEIKNDFGNIDVLVNNAGVSNIGLLTDVTDEEYDRIMGVNVKGVFNVTKAVLPGMIHNKFGSIINISSMWGEVGASCEVVYSASKAAVIGFTKALAKEVGPSGIRVNCITPGVIDTKMNSCHSDETMKELCEETPLGRIGTVQDVANVAVFLASDSASFVTGQVVSVSGGYVV